MNQAPAVAVATAAAATASATATATASASAPAASTTSRSGEKRGIKVGQKITSNKTNEDWYNAILLFHANKEKHRFTNASFLKSPFSGDLFDGNRSEQVTFIR